MLDQKKALNPADEVWIASWQLLFSVTYANVLLHVSFSAIAFTKTAGSGRIYNASADMLFVLKIESWEKNRHIDKWRT